MLNSDDLSALKANCLQALSRQRVEVALYGSSREDLFVAPHCAGGARARRRTSGLSHLLGSARSAIFSPHATEGELKRRTRQSALICAHPDPGVAPLSMTGVASGSAVAAENATAQAGRVAFERALHAPPAARESALGETASCGMQTRILRRLHWRPNGTNNQARTLFL